MNHSLISAIEGSFPVYRGQSKHNVPDSAGIYVLMCQVNDKPYVGRSLNLRNRFNEHHKPSYQRYNGVKLVHAKEKYGQENFVFYVIETCEPDELQEREDYYIQEFDSVINGYNTRHNSEGVERWKLNEEQRTKISDSLKKHYKQNKNPWKGKTHSAESRELIKKNIRNEDGTLKQQWSDERRALLREYGKEKIKYLEEWLRENEHPRKTKVVMLDKKTDVEIATFLSIKDALLFLEKPITFSGIVNVLIGTASTSCGYKWKYLNR